MDKARDSFEKDSLNGHFEAAQQKAVRVHCLLEKKSSENLRESKA